MTLKEHLDVITGPVFIHLIKDGKTLYRGYKGNAVDTEELKKEYEQQIQLFRVVPEFTRRDAPTELLELTVDTCGIYKYADLRMRLVYTYEM